MPILKHIPEDFLVEEIPQFTPQPGPFTILKITKRERNTEDVAAELAQKLNLSRKAIGYAGTKDKKAITTQCYSVKKELKNPPKINNCTTTIVGRAKEPLRLGMLNGNKFTITLRDAEQLNIPPTFPNYFGEQRFSADNAQIGLLLLKKQFVQAAQLINKSRIESLNADQPINEIQKLPRQLLKLYLHAAQSLLWNKIASNYLQSIAKTKTIQYSQGELHYPLEEVEQQDVPIPGFGVEYGKFANIAQQMLQDENLTARDFVIRQLPNLSLEGTTRKLLIDVQDLKISYQDDDLFKGKKKAILTFTLPKGSYATVLIAALQE